MIFFYFFHSFFILYVSKSLIARTFRWLLFGKRMVFVILRINTVTQLKNMSEGLVELLLTVSASLYLQLKFPGGEANIYPTLRTSL